VRAIGSGAACSIPPGCGRLEVLYRRFPIEWNRILLQIRPDIAVDP
jgi:hypothetical protein